ncbi:MAG TPA: M23 family metallopeptidase [Ignavibacteriaceae bacterium]|nr:M23 family metallopeptidase [Ignavibacteriaceae bacterium]
MKSLKKIKKFSLLIVPEETSNAPKSFKISSSKLIASVVIYTFVVFLLGFYVISYTPLNEILLPYSLRLTDSDKKKVDILNNKVKLLAKEVEALKSVNSRLKFAIMLGDTSLFKDDIKQKDTVKTIPKQGDLFAVVSKIISDLFYRQEKDIYFIRPVTGFVSNKFNPEAGHYGYDFALKENTPVYASSGGYIVFADYSPMYGYTIIINHPENYVTKYMHCAMLVKKEGEIVKQGELIALSGNSGIQSSGPHLHFEIWKDGKAIDPEKVLINF